MPFNKRLFFITPIVNVPSIMELGILSYKRVKDLPHNDTFALPEVQERREKKRVTNGKPLHEYANLYFDPRNPAMYKRRSMVEDLCVVVIHGEVLNTPGAIVSDMNAASDIVRFFDASEVESLDFDRIYAGNWSSCHGSDKQEIEFHRKQKCAEALIPDGVDFSYVFKICVASDSAKTKLIATGYPEVKIVVFPCIFFR